MHKCHAEGCEALVPTHLLMCHRHWRMVPPQIQSAVYLGWRVQKNQLQPVEGYVKARSAAIEAVKEVEGGDRHE
ncbi:MAG: hypothetical protein F6K28_48315 [Microcoleus sp. SIO2G3]|nr:hypothetical protein [Microcoleus sp. SIO2G3]